MVFETIHKFAQFAEFLTHEIVSGGYAVGEKLPSERALAKEHGMSSLTINKSIALLVDKGMVERRYGNGTFVCRTSPINRSRNVGMWILVDPKRHSVWYRALPPAIQDAGLFPTLFSFGPDGASDNHIAEFLKTEPRALLVDAHCQLNLNILKEKSDLTELIFVSRFDQERPDHPVFDNASYIMNNFRLMGRTAAESLLSQGCSRIVVCSAHWKEQKHVREYVEGVCECLDNNNLSPVLHDDSHTMRDAAFFTDTFRQLKPDGIIASVDYLAIAPHEAMQALKKRQGHDYYLITASNTPWAEMHKWSSVSYNEDVVALNALKVVQQGERITMQAPVSIITRESCPAPKGTGTDGASSLKTSEEVEHQS